jgi:outer membrane protein
MVKAFGWLIGVLSLVIVGSGQGMTFAVAADTIKIGFIDAQKVLDSTKLGKKAKANLEEYVKSREKILELERKDLKDLEEALSKQGALLSLEAKKDKQEEYQRKLEQFQKKALELNREVQDKQLELVKGFRKELEGVVKKIAEKEGYIFVLDKDSETGNILYAQDSFDLTNTVIAELDKTAK